MLFFMSKWYLIITLKIFSNLTVVLLETKSVKNIIN
jgi:hypothetical protein